MGWLAKVIAAILNLFHENEGTAPSQNITRKFTIPFGAVARAQGTANRSSLPMAAEAGMYARITGKKEALGKVVVPVGFSVKALGNRPATVPGAPTLVSAVGDDGEVTLTWTAPADNGGSPLIYYRPVRDGVVLSQVGLVLTWTDTNRNNGQIYTYGVRAVNVVGQSPTSNLLNGFPGALPAHPVLSATPGNGFVDLTWPDPNDNGSPITAFGIYFDGSGYDLAGPAANSYRVSGLVNGQNHDFWITASNQFGTVESNHITTAAGVPAAKPGTPTLTGTPGNNFVDLSWTAAAPNGATVTNYNVYRDGITTPYATLTTALTYRDNGAVNGSSHNYRVAAVNSIGEGPQSNSVTVVAGSTNPTPPSAPVLSGLAGNAKNDLSWPAASPNGSPVTTYKVWRAVAGGAFGTNPYATLGNVLAYSDTQVTNGTQYDYRVSALNAIGESMRSNQVTLFPSGAVGQNPPADITNSDGAWRYLAWGNVIDNGHSPSVWSARGIGGVIHNSRLLAGFGGGAPPTNNNSFLAFATPALAAGYEVMVGPYQRDDPWVAKTGDGSSFRWWDDVSLANWAARNAELAARAAEAGFHGTRHDSEVGSFTVTYAMNAAPGHTLAASQARIEKWGYETSKAWHQALPNCINVVYGPWHNIGGVASDYIYHNDPALYGETFWFNGWIRGMMDYGGPGCRLLNAEPWFYDPGSHINNVSVQNAHLYQTQNSLATLATYFTQAEWNKIGHKIDFGMMHFPGTDMGTKAPQTGTYNATTKVINMPAHNMASEATNRRYAIIKNATSWGVSTAPNGTDSMDYWVGVIDADNFYLHTSRSGPLSTALQLNHSGSITVEEFDIHTSYYHTDAGSFQQQVDLARQYGMGSRSVLYTYGGTLEDYTFVDYWHRAPTRGDVNNYFIVNPSNPPGGHLPALASIKNRTNPINTQAPTISRYSDGALNLADMTNLGGGIWRIGVRVAHPNGVRGATTFNRTTNPTLSGDGVKAKPVWDQGGGSATGNLGNAFMRCQMDVAASPGDRIFVFGYSVHDQRRGIAFNIPGGSPPPPSGTSSLYPDRNDSRIGTTTPKASLTVLDTGGTGFTVLNTGSLPTVNEPDENGTMRTWRVFKDRYVKGGIDTSPGDTNNIIIENVYVENNLNWWGNIVHRGSGRMQVRRSVIAPLFDPNIVAATGQGESAVKTSGTGSVWVHHNEIMRVGNIVLTYNPLDLVEWNWLHSAWTAKDSGGGAVHHGGFFYLGGSTTAGPTARHNRIEVNNPNPYNASTNPDGFLSSAHTGPVLQQSTFGDPITQVTLDTNFFMGNIDARFESGTNFHVRNNVFGPCNGYTTKGAGVTFAEWTGNVQGDVNGNPLSTPVPQP